MDDLPPSGNIPEQGRAHRSGTPLVHSLARCSIEKLEQISATNKLSKPLKQRRKEDNAGMSTFRSKKA